MDNDQIAASNISEKVVNLPEEDDDAKKVLFVNIVKLLGFAEPMTS